MIFAEVIGDLHHQEVREVFSRAPRLNQVIRTLDQVKVAMERCGVGVRVAADIVSKRYYPDIYEWLKFQCSIWAWVDSPFPAVDDPRLELFADRNTDPDGRIEVTHHACGWAESSSKIRRRTPNTHTSARTRSGHLARTRRPSRLPP
jgi:hypothetical protein